MPQCDFWARSVVECPAGALQRESNLQARSKWQIEAGRAAVSESEATSAGGGASSNTPVNHFAFSSTLNTRQQQQSRQRLRQLIRLSLCRCAPSSMFTSAVSSVCANTMHASSSTREAPLRSSPSCIHTIVILSGGFEGLSQVFFLWLERLTSTRAFLDSSTKAMWDRSTGQQAGVANDRVRHTLRIWRLQVVRNSLVNQFYTVTRCTTSASVAPLRHSSLRSMRSNAGISDEGFKQVYNGTKTTI